MRFDWRKINTFGRESRRDSEQGGGGAEADAASGRSGDDASVAERHTWAVRQRWITHAIRAAVFAAILAGVAGLVLALVGRSGSPAAATSPVEVAQPLDTVGAARAGEFATRFVVAWLQAARGQESEIGRLVGSAGDVSLPSVAQFSASEAAVASIEAVAGSAGMWSVTVGATVRSATDASLRPARRYFLAPVVVTPAGVRAAMLPAEVAGPASDITVDLGYRYRLSPQTSVVVSAAEFLSAMLTGVGDVSRYLTPGVTVTAVSPPPYRAVAIGTALSSVDLSATDRQAPLVDGEVVRLLVTTSQKTGTGEAVPGQVALTLTSRGGRWEVSGLDSSPLLPLGVGSATTRAPSVQPPSASPSAPPPAPPTASSPGVGIPTPATTPVAPASDVPLFSDSGAATPPTSPEGE